MELNFPLLVDDEQLEKGENEQAHQIYAIVQARIRNTQGILSTAGDAYRWV
jgi:hypothetical protein